MDPAKLIEQEPAFADFAKSVVFQIIMKNDANFLNILYSFYAAGSSTEQTAEVMTMFIKIHESI